MFFLVETFIPNSDECCVCVCVLDIFHGNKNNYLKTVHFSMFTITSLKYVNLKVKQGL